VEVKFLKRTFIYLQVNKLLQKDSQIYMRLRNLDFKKKLSVLITILIILLFIGYKIFRFIQIDNCLDKSGSWNYEKCECDFK
jgi:hypothetical protein